MHTKKKVFVLDDNSDFRSSVAWMLRGEGYMTVEFADGQRAITALRNTDPSELQTACLLLDVRMPVMSGLEFHEQLKSLDIRIPIIYMTGHGDIPLAVEAMKKGATTILEKPLDPEQLKSAIESSIKPERSAIGKDIVTTSLDDESCAIFLDRLKLLTPRESDVLNCLVEGQVNKVVASNLDISVRTVEVHRSRLMKKLNIKTASEAVKMVLLCQMKK